MNQVKSFDELQKLQQEKDQFLALFFLSENSAKSLIAQKILEKISESNSTPIWQVDVAKTRDIHPTFNVNQVPTLVTIKGGKVVKKLVGLQSERTYRNLFGSAPRKRADGTEAPPLRVTVYTTQTCPHCTTVKNHLKRKGIPYREVDVSRDASAATELQRKTGQTGVPQTDINGTFVLGADIQKINKLIAV